ncbi:MAG: protein TolR [Rhizobiaceae bacterium]|nr:protein TolR [Rhizobiaceae bacterium]
MAMSVGNSGGRSRRRGRRGPNKAQVMSEINVTPFVDVMLVLLIIFMVTAPLLTVGVPIDLPETKASQLNAESEPITISVKKEGGIFLQETEIPLVELVAKLKAIAKNGYEERIFVRGDKGATYGDVIEVMALISSSGYKRLAMITLQEQK